MSDTLTDVLAAVTRIETDVASIKENHPPCKTVKRLQATVEGNGRRGLKAQVWVLWGAFIVVGGVVASAATAWATGLLGD